VIAVRWTGLAPGMLAGRLASVNEAELVGSFIVAGGAARFAVHEAVLADANFEYRLAETAVLIALALSFRHFALGATVFGLASSRGHRNNVARSGGEGERSVGNRGCQPARKLEADGQYEHRG
jgi:hypothetical protein